MVRKGSTILPDLGNKIRQIRWENHNPRPLITLEIYIFTPATLPWGSYGSPKLLRSMYLKLAKIENYFFSTSRLGSLTLRPAACKDAYLHPIASKASGGRILNTNQFHNIEQILNTNQPLKKITPYINFRWATEEILNYRQT